MLCACVCARVILLSFLSEEPVSTKCRRVQRGDWGERVPVTGAPKSTRKHQTRNEEEGLKEEVEEAAGPCDVAQKAGMGRGGLCKNSCKW